MTRTDLVVGRWSVDVDPLNYYKVTSERLSQSDSDSESLSIDSQWNNCSALPLKNEEEKIQT